MRQKIAVVDYGMGNLHSVIKAFNYIAPDDQIEVAAEPAVLNNADRIVFPGVGAIRDCMRGLRKAGLDEAIRQNIKEKPLLAICVGMQALFGDNEEDSTTLGLEVFNGRVKSLAQAIPQQERLKIPHVGWNKVSFVPSPLWDGIEPNSYFYFLHSYYCQSADNSLVVANCDYGVSFAATAQKDNVFAVQFHPEKSHKDGLHLLMNFINWQP